jgi:hypothetical protein
MAYQPQRPFQYRALISNSRRIKKDANSEAHALQRRGREAVFSAQSSQGVCAPGSHQLLQLREFLFGLPENKDVGIGVFPEGEEVLIGGAGFDRVAF